MLKQLRFSQFKALGDFSLTDMEQVTLLTGMNSVGKSSVLEGAFLHLASHTPDVISKLGLRRGVLPVRDDAYRTWDWVFPLRSHTCEAVIESTDDRKVVRRVSARFESVASLVHNKAEQVIDLQEHAQRSIETELPDPALLLSFKSTDPAEPDFQSYVFFKGGDVGGQASLLRPFLLGAFLTETPIVSEETIERFSAIEEKGLVGSLVSTLQVLEPQLTGLSTAVLGGQAVLRARLADGTMFPVGHLGGGAREIIKYLLTIWNFANGVVLIDEIERGFHYSSLPHMWASVFQASLTSGCQVIATTHSRECVEAACAAHADSPSPPFALVRLERKHEGVSAVHYTDRQIGSALSHGFEVR